VRGRSPGKNDMFKYPGINERIDAGEAGLCNAWVLVPDQKIRDPNDDATVTFTTKRSSKTLSTPTNNH
jgi:hypothetical protein